MKYLNLEGLRYFWKSVQVFLKRIENQLPSTISGYEMNTKTGSMELYSVDLNTVTTSGFYNAMTCRNAKYSYSTLIVVGYYLAGYCTQIQTDVTTGNMAVRQQINYTWSPWKTINLSG